MYYSMGVFGRPPEAAAPAGVGPDAAAGRAGAQLRRAHGAQHRHRLPLPRRRLAHIRHHRCRHGRAGHRAVPALPGLHHGPSLPPAGDSCPQYHKLDKSLDSHMSKILRRTEPLEGPMTIYKAAMVLNVGAPWSRIGDSVALVSPVLAVPDFLLDMYAEQCLSVCLCSMG